MIFNLKLNLRQTGFMFQVGYEIIDLCCKLNATPPLRQPRLRVREVPGPIFSQGPRHTKDVIKMVPIVPLFSTQHLNGEILALSEELRQHINDYVMDKIWYRNPWKSEVIGRCGVDEKPNDHAEWTKVERLFYF